MKLEHRFTVPAPIQTVWAAFNDLEGLVPCVPGGTLTAAEADTFEGTVKVKLGPISMVYGGTGVFLERDEAAGRMVVEAKGKDKRGNGTAGANVVAQLTAEGESTLVQVSTDLSVTGKPAQFGRGVIQDVSDKLLGQFVDCFTSKLTASSADGGTTADAGASAGAAGASAADAGASPADASPADASPEPASQSPAPEEPTTPTAESAAPEPASPATPPRTAPAAHTEPTASAAPRTFATSAAPAEPAELDLLSTVMPVLVRRYAVPGIVALIAGVSICIWLIRRR